MEYEYHRHGYDSHAKGQEGTKKIRITFFYRGKYNFYISLRDLKNINKLTQLRSDVFVDIDMQGQGGKKIRIIFLLKVGIIIF